MKSKKPIDLKIDIKYAKKVKETSIHPNLMKAPFYLNIYAPGNSGKSLLVVNIVHKYKKIFKKGNIIIFTNSYDPTIYSLIDDRDATIMSSLYDEDGVNVLEQILDYQKKLKKNDPSKLEDTLIIFDDFITSEELNKRRSIIAKAYSSARHFQCSLIFCSQSYTMMPKPLRKMCFYNIFFKFPVSEEREIIDENCGFLNKEDFLKVYKYATSEKYHFLFCMLKEGRMLKDFEIEIANEKNGIIF